MSIPLEWQIRAKEKAEEVLEEYFETHPRKAPIPVQEVIEEFLGDVLFVPVMNPYFPEGISAFTRKDMQLGWIMVINEMECIERQRFSSAHELGHVVLIPPELGEIVYCSKDNGNWVERACDLFAGHFLMPEKAVRAYLRAYPSAFLEDIAKVFRVSRQVAEIQLRILGFPIRSQVGSAAIRF